MQGSEGAHQVGISRPTRSRVFATANTETDAASESIANLFAMPSCKEESNEVAKRKGL